MTNDLEGLKDWPSHGVTLSEARERMAPDECRLWRDEGDAVHRMGSGPNWLDGGVRLEEIHWEQERRHQARRHVDDLERKARAPLLAALQEGKLLAYGRKGNVGSAPELIAADIWPALVDIGFQNSAAGEGRVGGVNFFAIRIFDAVQGLSKSAQSTRTQPKKTKKREPRTPKGRLVQAYVDSLDQQTIDLKDYAGIASELAKLHPRIAKTGPDQLALNKMVERATKKRSPAG